MTAELIGWQDEHLLDHRRRMRNAMLVSLAIHGLVIAIFAATPGSPVVLLPEVLAVELVAAAPAPRSKPTPSPPKAAPPAPAPSAPEPPPAPEPPVAKAPVQVLPEESPGRIRKVETPPDPKVVAKVKPKPKPVPRRPKREIEPSLEDVMASLNDELGVDETADLLKPVARPSEDETSSAEAPADQQESRPGATISPELAKWNLDTQRRIQRRWVMPPNLRGRGLSTSLELNLAASGTLIGRPRIYQSSGDLDFDDNAVRALLMAAPLPPVAKPGRRIFIFRSEAN